MTEREALALQQARFQSHQHVHGCVIDALDPDDTARRPEPSAGPLAGVALAHKDIFDLAGWAPGLGQTHGRPAPNLPAATAIDRLAKAGATQLGTLAMAEHACGATGYNPNFAPILNPLDPLLAVGGSSSGSAVAVASELVYAALGTDTAGSVRIPAATCGLLGLKTTQGLIPTEGVHPLAPALDGIGLLTRSADDAQALLAVLAEPGALRPAVAQPRLKAWLPEGRLHTDVHRALNAFASEWPGSERQADLPEHALLTALSEIVLHTQAAHTHRFALLASKLSPGVESVALPGLAIPPDWYAAALNSRSFYAKAFFTAHLQQSDILMLPALPQPLPDWASVTVGNPHFDVKQLLALHAFMGFVNYLGFPSLVIPVASDARGRPISAQFIARPYEEQTLLAFAGHIQHQRFGSDGFTRRFTPLHG